jgi:hypothetical protein
MRGNFGREYIENELQELGANLKTSLEIYLIGGGAMSFLNLKDATKDIDVVVSNTEDLSSLIGALETRDYEKVKEPETEYEELGASAILENEDSCRFDIFDRQVVDKLIFSEGMEERSEEVMGAGNLTVKLTSPEDIFLFKSVAGRSTDIDDMNTLVQTGLDFETVEKEIERQTDLLEEELFVTYIGEALGELRERHGVTIPLTEYVQERSESFYEQLELLMEIREEGPISTERLVEETEVKKEVAEERLERLKERGEIRREDGYWATEE